MKFYFSNLGLGIKTLRFVAVLSLMALFFSSCQKVEKLKEPADYVNPFIGTGGHGHTYPGAVVPFGMVQLSPDTKIDDWDHCSGYHFSDSVVLGFSHTHLSGTGIGDYGDIRFMPFVGDLKINLGTAAEPDSGYASRFSHNREMAEAGYYKVHLDDYNIDVELTATDRVGVQRYTFPKSDNAHVILDLKEAVTTEKILHAEFLIRNNHEIVGYRRTDGWADDHYVFFYASFSKPFKSYGSIVDGKVYKFQQGVIADNIKAYFDFDTEEGETIVVKTGISAVDMNGAYYNLKKEMPNWNFDSVRTVACEKWNDQLGKIIVGGGSNDDKTIFYTALYHSMLAPNIYSDADHRYRGHDNKIYTDASLVMHTVFSLWDTFRALHPLFTIIERDRTGFLINSMLDMYEKDSLLPVWELAANETNCMIGYHSVSVITDAYIKGITTFDAHEALQAMVKTADANHFGLEFYKKKGYIPSDKEGASVSRTLEYAYDDWCIAQMAHKLGEKKIYSRFIKRAQYYKNIYDRETGFFRAKANGCFTEPFDPRQVNFNLTEANTWQYNFFVPQDVNTLIDMMGGDGGFDAKLDTLFTMKSELTGRKQSDITGLIGQYAHGNEPSHNMAYLYNFVGKPWKTQQLVNKISHELYKNAPDGLAGNEDCGQMSAWYVLSAMGFYPVTPGTDEYEIGTPLFDSVVINLENGHHFMIKAENRSKENFYIQSAIFNGKPYSRSYITQDMILNGGTLAFKMGSKPDKSWGSAAVGRPVRRIEDDLITPVPYFKAKSKTFLDRMTVSLADVDTTVQLKIKKGNHAWKDYKEPFKIHGSSDFEAKAIENGVESFPEEAQFFKIPKSRKVTLKTKYNAQYTAGGDNALINTLRGGTDFRTGNWQGYESDDMDAIIDLGKEQMVHKMGIGFLQDENSWIFMPQWVSFEVSEDGVNYQQAGKVKTMVDEHQTGTIVKDFVLKNVNRRVRYIHVFAKNRGTCPQWHKGYPNKSWIFTDEFWVK